MKTYKIAVIPGDGVGPEVLTEGMKVLKRVAELDGTFQFAGGVVRGSLYDGNSWVGCGRTTIVSKHKGILQAIPYGQSPGAFPAANQRGSGV